MGDKKQNFVKMRNDVLAMKSDKLHPTAKLVYAAILVFAHNPIKTKGVPKGSAEITRFTLGAHLNIKKRTITKYLTILRDMDLIEIDYGYNSASVYTPVDVVDDKDYTKLLHVFVLYRAFTHTQKMFMISIAKHILSKEDHFPTIYYTYSDMAELTGLNERFIANQVRSLCNTTKDGVAVMKKIKSGGWRFNPEAIANIGDDELLAVISEKQLETQRANNLDNKRK